LNWFSGRHFRWRRWCCFSVQQVENQKRLKKIELIEKNAHDVEKELETAIEAADTSQTDER
jgi:hypothetical protein